MPYQATAIVTPMTLSPLHPLTLPPSAVHSWELFAFGDDFGFGCAEFG